MTNKDELIAIDKRVTRILMITAVVVVILLIGVVALVPISLSTSNDADQVRIGNELSACRSIAWADVALADSNASALIIEALAALQQGNTARFNSIITQEADEAVNAQRVAQLQYQLAVDRSREESQAFLGDCRAGLIGVMEDE